MPKNSYTTNFKTYNLYLIVVVGLIASLVYYCYQNSVSYREARVAKNYYDRGEYQKALDLALKVQEENSYNIMAFTIVEQSKKAIEWHGFIKLAREYEMRTRMILEQDNVTSSDLAKIKMMAEAVVYDYTKLGDAGILMHNELKAEAKRLDNEFRSVLEKLSKI